MNTARTITTITCPKCNQTLPGWADKCQFCGHQIAKGYVRPTDANRYQVDNRMTWQEVAYIIVSAIMLLNGVYYLLQAGNVVPSAVYTVGGSGFLAFFGGLQVILGTGLLFQQGWAQFIVKLLSWLAIAGSLAQLFLSMLYIGHMRGAGTVVAMNLFYAVYWGAVAYLIATVGDA